MRVGIVYEVTPNKCLICGHEWTAIIECDQITWPDGTKDTKYADEIQCPACKIMTPVQREKKTMLERIMEELPEQTFIKIKRLDEAIIGVDEDSMRLVYSIKKAIDILMAEDGLDYDSAIELLYFDIIGPNVNGKNPIWVTDNI